MHTSKPSSPWQQRNTALLAAYAAERTIERRNAVVHANLPLAWQAARRESQRSGHSFEDLSQVAGLGLIRAVEAFDPDRRACLSTAAMPWMVGAMRQYLRDRCQPLRGGRSLRELSARANSLLKQQPLLCEQELVQALGCSPAQWRAAQELQRALKLSSLDQPLSHSDGEPSCLKEQLSDPSATDSYGAARRSERRRLLWGVLAPLERSQRRLLLGRVLQQRSWPELGKAIGLSGRAAQRRFLELLAQLRTQLGPELGAELLEA